MNNKVTIIGAGSVGATVAYTLVATGSVAEIVLIDVNEAKAKGEAMDILQATPYLSPAKIYYGTYEDAVGSDIVVVTSGVGRKPGQSRIDLTQINVNILKSIAPQIVKYAPDALYLFVANPVDVLTYTFHQVTNIPTNRIIGSGTSLDTARLKTRLSEIYKVSPKQVHANVLGEHGDTSFVAWSMARIAGVPIDEYSNALINKDEEFVLDKDEVTEYVKKSGGVIISRKGATYNGVAAAVVYICKALFTGVDSILCLSVLMKGEYGIEDVCLSIPVLLGSQGIVSTLAPELTEKETELLKISAEAMKSVISQVNCK